MSFVERKIVVPGWIQWLGLAVAAAGAVLSLRRGARGIGLPLLAAGGATTLLLAGCGRSSLMPYDTIALTDDEAFALVKIATTLDHYYSGNDAMLQFRDVIPVFTDDGAGSSCDGDSDQCYASPKQGHPQAYLPLTYYYSPSLHHTFIVTSSALGILVGIAAGLAARIPRAADLVSLVEWSPTAQTGYLMSANYIKADTRLGS